jgi:hypothetical protein
VRLRQRRRDGAGDVVNSIEMREKGKVLPGRQFGIQEEVVTEHADRGADAGADLADGLIAVLDLAS